MIAMKIARPTSPATISRVWPLSRTDSTNARPSTISSAAISPIADHERGQRG